MGGPEIEWFLTDLAVHGHVAASTQNQALNALLFLYGQVLGVELPRLDAVRARRPRRLPNVLAPEEVRRVLDAIEGGGRKRGHSSFSIIRIEKDECPLFLVRIENEECRLFLSLLHQTPSTFLYSIFNGRKCSDLCRHRNLRNVTRDLPEGRSKRSITSTTINGQTLDKKEPWLE
jgi:hypothetical protein